MITLYSLLTFPLSLLYGLFLACTERGKIRLIERFGSWGVLPPRVLWFHGASVGEVNGLAPIINALKSDTPILITVTSATALEAALALTPHVRILPFDCPLWIMFALRSLKIEMLVVGETEIWPALYAILGQRQVPVVIVNGRLSESSVSRYAIVMKLLPKVLRALSRCLCVDEKMRERFLEVGVPTEKLSIVGNTKYARKPLAIKKGEFKKERFQGAGAHIVIGNIRPGEEEILFPAIRATIARYPQSCIAIVPRHKEKYTFFIEALTKAQIPFVAWSERRSVAVGEVLFVDTFGYLERIYADADGAFIGGSLVDFGGHNPLEPAPYGVSIAVGPYTGSTGALVEELTQYGGVTPVQTIEELTQFFAEVCEGAVEQKKKAEALYRFWLSQQDSVDKTVNVLREVLHG